MNCQPDLLDVLVFGGMFIFALVSGALATLIAIEHQKLVEYLRKR